MIGINFGKKEMLGAKRTDINERASQGIDHLIHYKWKHQITNLRIKKLQRSTQSFKLAFQLNRICKYGDIKHIQLVLPKKGAYS